MKLFMTATSPYARKCRILARELDLMGQIEEIPVDLADKAMIRAFNPLGKIPALALDDGSVILDSPVICEYLDDFAHGKFFPKPTLLSEAKGRWKELTLQAIGDGLTDAAVAWMLEGRRPAALQSQKTFEKNAATVSATLDVLERLAPHFAQYPMIGEIAIGCAVSFIGQRCEALAWQENRPQLAAWQEKFECYPSVRETRPEA